MIDDIKVSHVRQDTELFEGFGSFAIVKVSPRRDSWDVGSEPRPIMPLLVRGQHFDDDSGDVWTVLRATVRWEEATDNQGDSYYWYEYDVVSGQHSLH